MSAARHLRIAPTDAEVLAAEITALCTQIDRRNGTPPGTAERAVYFWYWPPDTPGVDTLTRLHADAAEFLHTLTTGAGR